MGELKVNSGALFLFCLWQKVGKLCQVFAAFPKLFFFRLPQQSSPKRSETRKSERAREKCEKLLAQPRLTDLLADLAQKAKNEQLNQRILRRVVLCFNKLSPVADTPTRPHEPSNVCEKIIYILYIAACIWCPLFTAIFHNISGNFNKTRYQRQTAGLPSKLQRRSFDFQFPFLGIFLCFNYACNSIGCSVPLSHYSLPFSMT